MTKDLLNARTLLDSGDFTCTVCLGDASYTTRERGVKPLLNWLDSGITLTGFSAADRVVGRGAAFLYCLLGVREVYARVMSRPAAQVLTAHGIDASYDTLTEGIINRRGDGPCPFEAAVLDISDPQLALAAIRARMQNMTGGT